MADTKSPEYTREFYDSFRKGARESAEQVVPLVLELVECSSVVDFGCGLGTWASVFEQHGVPTVLGIDGDYVDRRSLEISANKFVAADLSSGFKVDKQFDLAISLEVAEHIPESSVDTFFDSLVSLAPVVLFSAALPYQEGCHHVNEQWPEYWIRHFDRRGFVAIDCLRPRIWTNERVEWWYAQNALLFVRRDRLGLYPRLRDFVESSPGEPLPMIHPRLFLHKQDELSRLQRENEQLKQRLGRLSSPVHVASLLPRFLLTKARSLLGAGKARTARSRTQPALK